MRNLILLLLSVTIALSCRSIPSEEISQESPQIKQNIVEVKSNYKMEVLGSKYLVFSSATDEMKYVILLDENESASKLIDTIKYEKTGYKIDYSKNYIVATHDSTTILFNIPSYNDLSKLNMISNLKPNKVINVAGITQTNAALHLLTYYNEDDPGESGGTGVGIKCTHGGPGAVHCATNSTVGPISTGCEVTCETGYYACCDDGRTLCKCIKKK